MKIMKVASDALPSPCSVCVVRVMCKNFCDDTREYIRENDKVDRYVGDLISRLIGRSYRSVRSFWEDPDENPGGD